MKSIHQSIDNRILLPLKAACLLFFAWSVWLGSTVPGFTTSSEPFNGDFSDHMSFELETLLSKHHQEPVVFEVFIPLEEAFATMYKQHSLNLTKVSSPKKGIYELGNAKLLGWKTPVVTYQGKLGIWVVRHYEGHMGWLMVEDVKGVNLYAIHKPNLTSSSMAFTWSKAAKPLNQLPNSKSQILVSKDFPIDPAITFKAKSLKALGIPGRETIEIHEQIGIDLKALIKAAKKEGHSLLCTSGYRSVAKQRYLLENEVQLLTSRGFKNPLAEARKTINLPGQSEHHTGYAVDLLSNRIFSTDAFYGTKEAAWLELNAPRFGFVIRYPKNKTHLTGISHEPWHLRYVGKSLAPLLTQKQWTLEEWIQQGKKGIFYQAENQKMKYYKVMDLKRGGTAWVKPEDLNAIKIYYITKHLIGLEFEVPHLVD